MYRVALKCVAKKIGWLLYVDICTWTTVDVYGITKMCSQEDKDMHVYYNGCIWFDKNV